MHVFINLICMQRLIFIIFVCAGNNGSTVCMICFVWPDERTLWIALSSGYQEQHPMPPLWRACQNEEDKP